MCLYWCLQDYTLKRCQKSRKSGYFVFFKISRVFESLRSLAETSFDARHGRPSRAFLKAWRDEPRFFTQKLESNRAELWLEHNTSAYSRVSNKRAGCNNHAGFKISKISNHAGWNFSKINSKKVNFAWKFPNIDKCAGCNKTMQVGIFEKINKNMLHVY